MKCGKRFAVLWLVDQHKIAREIQEVAGSAENIHNSFMGRTGDLFIQVSAESAFSNMLRRNRLGECGVFVELPKRDVQSMGVMSNVPLHFTGKEIEEA